MLWFALFCATTILIILVYVSRRIGKVEPYDQQEPYRQKPRTDHLLPPELPIRPIDPHQRKPMLHRPPAQEPPSPWVMRKKPEPARHPVSRAAVEAAVAQTLTPTHGRASAPAAHRNTSKGLMPRGPVRTPHVHTGGFDRDRNRWPADLDPSAVADYSLLPSLEVFDSRAAEDFGRAPIGITFDPPQNYTPAPTQNYSYDPPPASSYDPPTSTPSYDPPPSMPSYDSGSSGGGSSGGDF